jgi:hypothetical protein
VPDAILRGVHPGGLSVVSGHAADLDARIRELHQLRGELRQLADRAATLDPEKCSPERICHIITLGLPRSDGQG